AGIQSELSEAVSRSEASKANHNYFAYFIVRKEKKVFLLGSRHYKRETLISHGNLLLLQVG
ncbi:MAG TPA: hypothetical protein PLJ84_02215, partial [Bacteroidales bacterium]|nr:hypothetical protein [Bacteroidales bacterium]HPT01384.1 hypothetical protein [Bacteroidales bacterium]